MKLIQQIANIYGLIGDDKIRELGLFDIKNSKLITPVSDDTVSLFDYRSPRPDKFLDQSVTSGLIGEIKANEHYLGLNHIGFCYKVDSKATETKRVAKMAKSKNCPLYQEPSNDEGDWLFAGDISESRNPVLEFISHEGQGRDRWIDYWLPHVQFDIDTGLSPAEIEVIVKKYISGPDVPYSIQINGITYIQRVNLGCVEGVNIFLDLSTNNRGADNSYRKYWNRLA